MKAEIKIPDGWRRLRTGSRVHIGEDRWFFAHDMEWVVCGLTARVGVELHGIYIRKSKQVGGSNP